MPMTAPKHALPWLLALLCSAGCDVDFAPIWMVDTFRPEVARVEIADDPGRAWLRPGDQVQLQWLLAGPVDRVPPPVTASWDACISITTYTGDPVCIFDLSDFGDIQERADARLSPDRFDMHLSVPMFSPDVVAPFAAGAPPSEMPAEDPAVACGEGGGSGQGAVSTPAVGALPPVDLRLLVYGVFCFDGDASQILDEPLDTSRLQDYFRCEANDETAEGVQKVLFTKSLLWDEGALSSENLPTNYNPDFARADDQAPVELVEVGALDGDSGDRIEPWLPVISWQPEADDAALFGGGCAADARFDGLRVQAGLSPEDPLDRPDAPWLVRIHFDDSDRDLEAVTACEMGPEELVVASAISDLGGELGGYFTVLPRESSDLVVELEYWPLVEQEEDLPGVGGHLVRFYLVVRDQRGGADFTTRELCLLPRPKV